MFLFFSLEQFEQFHSALRRTLRDSVTHPQDFDAFFIQSRAAFIPFSFRFIFLFFNRSTDFRCVFTKTIILLELAEYEMIITNSALRSSLVIYDLIFDAPS